MRGKARSSAQGWPGIWLYSFIAIAIWWSAGVFLVPHKTNQRATDVTVTSNKADTDLGTRKMTSSGTSEGVSQPAEPSQASSWSATCADKHADCSTWQSKGLCTANAVFMLRQCPQSCFGCLKPRSQIPSNGHVQLSSRGNGVVAMPIVGLGTAGLQATTAAVVEEALNVGYRLVDTASAREWYREDLVSNGLAATKVARENVFITSKLHPRDLGMERTRAAVQKSLQDLQVTYVDLYLLHYPRCWPALCGEDHQPQGTWKDSWSVLEEYVTKGVIKAIGVSNFELAELIELREISRIVPSVVQRFADPLHQDTAVRVYCQLTGMVYQAYSSLGTQEMQAGHHINNPVLGHPTIVSLARNKGWTTAQLVLRWALQSGQAILPRSRNKAHLRDNIGVLQLAGLSDQEMQALDDLDNSL